LRCNGVVQVLYVSPCHLVLPKRTVSGRLEVMRTQIHFVGDALSDLERQKVGVHDSVFG
jgi:hypothetical protein